MSGILMNGTATSTLTITITPASPGKLATTTAHYLEIDDGIRTISAKGLDLIGMPDLGNGRLTLTGAPATATVTLGRLVDVNATSTLPLSLTVIQWNNVDAAVETLTAPALTALNVTGDTARSLAGNFGVDLHLTRAGLTTGYANTLATATIAGNLSSALWDIAGPVGSITASGTVANWQLGTPGGALTNIVTGLTLGTVQTASVYVDQKIASLKAINWGDGTITAGTLTTLSATGKAAAGTNPAIPGFFGADLELSGKGATATTNTLGTATIAGDLNSELWSVTGQVGSITANGTVADWQLGTPGGALTNIVTGLTLGTVQTADLYVDRKITSLKAINWNDGTITAGTLATLSITGKAAVRTTPAVPGFFGADLELSGKGAAANTNTLGTATITGNLNSELWSVTGQVGSIAASGTVADWQLGTPGGALTSIVTALTLGPVQTASVYVDRKITSLKAINWDIGTIEAGTLATLSITGKAAVGATPAVPGFFGADLTLSGKGATSSSYTMSTATIAGDLRSHGGTQTWSIVGKVNTITASGNTEHLHLGSVARQLSAITSLTLGTVADATVVVDTSIGTLTAVKWDAGKVTAGSMTTMRILGKPASSASPPPIIRGDFGANLDLNRNGIAQTSTANTLGTVTIAGDLKAASWEIMGSMGVMTVTYTLGATSATNAEMLRIHTTGTIAGITAGAIRHTDVLAGVTTVDPTSRRVTNASEFTNATAAIKSVVVTGWNGSVVSLPSSLFEDSNFSAAAITTATILNADWSNLNDPLDPASGTQFGLFAKGVKTAITTVISKDTVQTTDTARNWTWKSATGSTGVRGPAGSQFVITVV